MLPAIETVLVTGASGFIGRAVVREVAASGRSVVAVARHAGDVRAPGVTWHCCDLLDARARHELVRNVRADAAIHCAWYAVHGAFWTAPENIAWTSATTDLFRKLAGIGVHRFLGIGTCAEYDWSLDDRRPWQESRACRPSSAYGQSKLAAFEALRALAAESNLSFAWARLFHTFGPEEPPTKLVASLCRALVRGEAAPCADEHRARDFLDVGDVARAIAGVLFSNLAGPVNIGRGEAITIGTIATALGRLSGRPDLIQIGALQMRADEPEYIVADTSRLAAATSFQPSPLDEGLSACLIRRREAQVSEMHGRTRLFQTGSARVDEV